MTSVRALISHTNERANISGIAGRVVCVDEYGRPHVDHEQKVLTFSVMQFTERITINPALSFVLREDLDKLYVGSYCVMQVTKTEWIKEESDTWAIC